MILLILIYVLYDWEDSYKDVLNLTLEGLLSLEEFLKGLSGYLKQEVIAETPNDEVHVLL
jgi:hypothetical protein